MIAAWLPASAGSHAAGVLLAGYVRRHVGESTLLVRSGPWREIVPLSDIRKLRRTRIPVAAPALSTDRIQVLYETSRSVLVSPADRDAFIRAIRARVPGIALEGFAETG
jgi:hypothetical protein